MLCLVRLSPYKTPLCFIYIFCSQPPIYKSKQQCFITAKTVSAAFVKEPKKTLTNYQSSLQDLQTQFLFSILFQFIIFGVMHIKSTVLYYNFYYFIFAIVISAVFCTILLKHMIYRLWIKS